MLSCVEMEIFRSSFIPFFARRMTEAGVVPRPETPGFLSKIRLPTIIVPMRSLYLCLGNYRPFKDIQGDTVTLSPL